MNSQTVAVPVFGWSATCRRGWNRASTASSVVSQIRTVHGPGAVLSVVTDGFRTAMHEISVAGQVRCSHDDAGPASCATAVNPLKRPKATTAARASRPSDSVRTHLGRRDPALTPAVPSSAPAGSLAHRSLNCSLARHQPAVLVWFDLGIQVSYGGFLSLLAEPELWRPT